MNPHDPTNRKQRAPRYDNPFLPDDATYPPAPERSAREVERCYANALQIFALCRRTACYRARRCTGNPYVCVPRFEPMVPKDARQWLKFVRGEHDHDSIVRGFAWAHPYEHRAMRDWIAAVEASGGPRIEEDEEEEDAEEETDDADEQGQDQ